MPLSERRAAEGAAVVGAVVLSGAAQFTSKILLFGLNIVTALAIVRYLGPATYGDYIFVLSFSAVFGLFSELGLNKVVAREMSREGSAIPQLIGTAIAGQLLLAGIGWIAAQLVFSLIGGHAELRPVLAIVSLLYFTEAFSLAFAAIFQVRLALQYDAAARIIAQVVDTALILWLIRTHAALIALVTAPVAAGAVGVLAAGAFVYLRFRTSVKADFSLLPRLVREALPVGLTSIVVIAYLRLDSVLLGILGTSIAVGYYGAASRPVEYLILALAVLVNVMFPLLARWHGVDPARFAALYANGASGLLAISLPIAVMVMVFAGPVVALLYPTEFAPSSPILQLVVGSVVFTVLGAWAGFALLSAGRQRIVLICNSGALVLNLAMNLALIPAWGATGAGVAAVLTSIVVAGTTMVAAALYLSVSLDLHRLARLIAANLSLAAIAIVTLWVEIPWLIAASLALCSYPIWLVLWRAVRQREIVAVLAAIRGAGRPPLARSR